MEEAGEHLECSRVVYWKSLRGTNRSDKSTQAHKEPKKCARRSEPTHYPLGIHFPYPLLCHYQ